MIFQSTPIPLEPISSIALVPSPLNKNHDPRSHRRDLAKRLLSIVLVNCIMMGALMGCLRGFGIVKSLNTWEKRVFNALSLSITALVSIGIGSLVSEIGSMIRWPLLSREPHTLDDVCISIFYKRSLNINIAYYCVRLMKYFPSFLFLLRREFSLAIYREGKCPTPQ